MTQELRRVRIEGFHGLRGLDVDVSALTVLLGESRSGKTSILDALERCLGVERTPENPFDASDFECPGDSPVPIEITLQFGGEPVDPVLEELCWPGRGGEPQLTLRVSAACPGEAKWAFLNASRGVLYDDAPASLCNRVRALHPLLHLSADRYTHLPDRHNGDSSACGSVETLSQIFQRLVARRGSLSRVELREGLELLRTAVASGAGNGASSDSQRLPRATERLRDIVDAPGRLRAIPDEVLAGAGGVGTQGLALFLLVAFLLDVRAGESIAEGAHPILAIEQPELRLHPTMAASLWGILELLPGQRIVTTNSPQLLAGAPLSALRRLTRHGDQVVVHRLRRKTLNIEELRRIAFHMRLLQGASLFARCWLLVEGESEVWLVAELARQCGYVLPAEGVACITFAQCGLDPIIRLADDLGIAWHVLVDGDAAGERYAHMARHELRGRPEERRITRLPAPDIERFMWAAGYSNVFRRAAGDLKPKRQRKHGRRGKRRGFKTQDVIRRAIRSVSKPGLALRVAVAVAHAGGPGVPEVFRTMLDHTVNLARESVSETPAQQADTA